MIIIIKKNMHWNLKGANCLQLFLYLDCLQSAKYSVMEALEIMFCWQSLSVNSNSPPVSHVTAVILQQLTACEFLKLDFFLMRYLRHLRQFKKSTFTGCIFDNQRDPKGLLYSRCTCVTAMSWDCLRIINHLLIQI